MTYGMLDRRYVLSRGGVAGMPEMSLGNGYTIDLADGWTFVHALEDAVNEMQVAWTINSRNVQIRPPGNDAHSQTFSSSMASKAVDAHQKWHDDKVNQLEGMIQNITGMLHQYQITETANSIKWTAPETYNPNQDSNDIPRGPHGAV
jgi:hypothetical protein